MHCRSLRPVHYRRRAAVRQNADNESSYHDVPVATLPGRRVHSMRAWRIGHVAIRHKLWIIQQKNGVVCDASILNKCPTVAASSHLFITIHRGNTAIPIVIIFVTH